MVGKGRKACHLSLRRSMSETGFREVEEEVGVGKGRRACLREEVEVVEEDTGRRVCLQLSRLRPWSSRLRRAFVRIVRWDESRVRRRLCCSRECS